MSQPADALGSLAGRLASAVARLDPHATGELAELRGKTIALESVPRGLRYVVSPDGEGVSVRAHASDPADLTVRGTPVAFARALLSRGDPQGWSRAGLAFEGDARLAGRLRRMLARFDPDLEEPLSWVVGDVAARHLGNAARAFNAYLRESTDLVAGDVGEYLQEEARLLAPRTRVEAFLRGVDTLRADTERLAARIARLRTGA